MTKKLLPLLLCLALLWGCAGRGAAVKPQPPNSLDATVTAVYNDLQIKAHISRPSASACTIAFEEPEALAGMTLAWTGQQATVTYKGLTYGVDSTDFPQVVFGTNLLKALNQMLMDQQFEPTYDGDHWSYSGDGFTARFDPQTGQLQSLTTDDGGFVAEFTEVKS